MDAALQRQGVEHFGLVTLISMRCASRQVLGRSEPEIDAALNSDSKLQRPKCALRLEKPVEHNSKGLLGPAKRQRPPTPLALQRSDRKHPSGVSIPATAV